MATKAQKKKWTTISDKMVRHIWADPDGSNEVSVDPDYYGENGTPVCGHLSDFEGEDMIYVRTEILA